MLIVSPTDATPGMTLVAPVHNPTRPDQELLKRGFTLDATMVGRLIELGVEALYVDFPGLEDVDRHLAPFLSPERQKICSLITSAIQCGQESQRPDVPFNDYYTSIREMVLTLIAQGKHPIFLDQMSRLGDGEVAHCAAVAHLALLLGLRLERYLIDQRSKRLDARHAREVVNLGVAGMLHDIGKTRLPTELTTVHTASPPIDDPDALELYQSHPRLGYDMVQGSIEPSAAVAILHHHQRYDGAGFPLIKHRDGTKSLPKGDRIHVFARILHVADLYDRIATPVGRKRLPNIQVLHYMREHFSTGCDPTILRALHAVAPPYPPGGKVILSDGTTAVVVKVDPADPFRPLVRRIKGDGFEFDGPTVPLLRNPDLSVASVAGVATAAYLPRAPVVAIDPEPAPKSETPGVAAAPGRGVGKSAAA